MGLFCVCLTERTGGALFNPSVKARSVVCVVAFKYLHLRIPLIVNVADRTRFEGLIRVLHRSLPLFDLYSAESFVCELSNLFTSLCCQMSKYLESSYSTALPLFSSPRVPASRGIMSPSLALPLLSNISSGNALLI